MPNAPLVLLLAGLPGAGKTTLAHRLAPEIDAVILSRDEIRDAIFPQHYLDYTREQNKVATDALMRVLDYLLERPRPPYVIVDGKPFSRRKEISEVKALVDHHGARLLIIHCVAAPAIVSARLERDLSDARNVRAQRNPQKADRIRQEFEDIALPHVTIDTSGLPDAVLHECLAHVRALAAS